MIVRPRVTRYEEHKGESALTRLRNLENDLDEFERRLATINAKLDWILRAVVGASLTLAANIALRLINQGGL